MRRIVPSAMRTLLVGGILGKIPRPSLVMSVALLALVIAASGTAVAAISYAASDGTITTCRDNKTGVLRVIQSGQSCTSKETTITWKDGITGKVANSDLLDGQDSSGFYAAGSKVEDSNHADQADQAANATKLDNKQAADFIQRNPAGPQNGSINIDGTLRTSGMVRTGSETGTFHRADYGLSTYEGLVVRRATASHAGAGDVIARTDQLRLERDGTMGGLRVGWNAGATPNNVIACMGLTQDGTPVGHYSRVGGSTAGTSQVYTDSQNVVYCSCSFGHPEPSRSNHVTEVTMVREPGFKVWVGTLRSSVNQ